MFKSKREMNKLTKEALQQLEMNTRRKWVEYYQRSPKFQPNVFIPAGVQQSSKSPRKMDANRDSPENSYSKANLSQGDYLAAYLFDLWLKDYQQSELEGIEDNANNIDKLPLQRLIENLLKIGLIYSEKLACQLMMSALGISQKESQAEEIIHTRVSKRQFCKLFQAGPRQDKIIEAIQKELYSEKKVSQNEKLFKNLQKGDNLINEIEQKILGVNQVETNEISKARKAVGLLNHACMKELTKIVNEQKYDFLRRLLDFECEENLGEAKIVSFVKLCQQRKFNFQRNPNAFKKEEPTSNDYSGTHSIRQSHNNMNPESQMRMQTDPPQIVSSQQRINLLSFENSQLKSRSATPSNMRKKHPPDIVIENAQLFDSVGSSLNITIDQQNNKNNNDDINLLKTPTIGSQIKYNYRNFINTKNNHITSRISQYEEDDEDEEQLSRRLIKEEGSKKMRKIKSILKQDLNSLLRQEEYLNLVEKIRLLADLTNKIGQKQQLLEKKKSNIVKNELQNLINKFEDLFREINAFYGRPYCLALMSLMIDSQVFGDQILRMPESIHILKLLLEIQVNLKVQSQKNPKPLPNEDLIHYFNVVQEKWWSQVLDPQRLQIVKRCEFEKFLKNKNIIADVRELQRISLTFQSIPQQNKSKVQGLEEYIKKSEYLRIMSCAILRFALSRLNFSLPVKKMQSETLAQKVIEIQRKILVDGIGGQTRQETQKQSAKIVEQLQKIEGRKRRQGSQNQTQLTMEFNDFKKQNEKRYTHVLEENQGPSSQTPIPFGVVQYKRPQLIDNHLIKNETQKSQLYNLRELTGYVNDKLQFTEFPQPIIVQKVKSQIRQNHNNDFKMQMIPVQKETYSKDSSKILANQTVRLGLSQRQMMALKINNQLYHQQIPYNSQLAEKQRLEVLKHF